MQISSVNNTPNFGKFNMPKVLYEDGYKLVKNELPELKQLGEKYDINLLSEYVRLLDTEFLTAIVTPLNANSSFWSKLFGKKGIKVVDTINCSSAVNMVEQAITKLNKNI